MSQKFQVRILLGDIDNGEFRGHPRRLIRVESNEFGDFIADLWEYRGMWFVSRQRNGPLADCC